MTPDYDLISPAEAMDPLDVPLAFPEIVALYERDVDCTLLRENLKLTPGQRLAKLEEFTVFLDSLRHARVVAETP